jgi:hypothetical protein
MSSAIAPARNGGGFSRINLAQTVKVCPGARYSASVDYQILSTLHHNSYMFLIAYTTAGTEIDANGIEASSGPMNTWRTFSWSFVVPVTVNTIWFSISTIEGAGTTTSLLVDNANLSAA